PGISPGRRPIREDLPRGGRLADQPDGGRNLPDGGPADPGRRDCLGAVLASVRGGPSPKPRPGRGECPPTRRVGASSQDRLIPLFLNITFLVERPTQFEAPFYRFVAGDPQ